MVKNEETGKYVLNKEELAKSSYNNEEKAAIIAWFFYQSSSTIWLCSNLRTSSGIYYT